MTGQSRKKLKKVLRSSYRDDFLLPASFMEDKKLSGNRVKVITDTSSSKTYVAHRGTANLKDWMTDFAAALGYEGGNRFQHSAKIQKKAEAKYGSQNIITVGHSLGGRIAEKVGKKSSAIVTYNKFVTPRSILESYAKPLPKMQLDLRTKKDAVSAGAKYQSRKGTLINIKSESNPVKAHNIGELA